MKRPNSFCLALLLVLSACKAQGPGAGDNYDGSAEAQADLTAPPTCDTSKCLISGAVCCGDEECVDTQTNPRHCGGCGKFCDLPQMCMNGSCLCKGGGGMTSCSSGTFCCPGPAGGCKDVKSDARNCGNCGHGCKGSETCSGGMCQCGAGPGCTGSKNCCGGACVDTSNDPNNCGSCGKKCAAGKACMGGLCEGECVGCMMPNQCCGFSCVDVSMDVDNCGKCGNKCPPPLPGFPPSCLFGFCVVINLGDGGLPPPPDM